MKSLFIIATTATLMLPGLTNAAEIKVLSTQATEGTYRELAPQFEKATGHKVTTIFTGTLDVQKRLAAGESYDIIIMARPAKHLHWCCCFPDMRASRCSSRKSNAGAQLDITD